MTEATFVVIYPVPTDIDEFEKRYEEEHLPMAFEKLEGKKRFIGTRIISAVGGAKVPYHRIAQFYFSSMQELKDCLLSPGGQETARHAIEISTGGTPRFLMAETEVVDFQFRGARRQFCTS